MTNKDLKKDETATGTTEPEATGTLHNQTGKIDPSSPSPAADEATQEDTQASAETTADEPKAPEKDAADAAQNPENPEEHLEQISGAATESDKTSTTPPKLPVVSPWGSIARVERRKLRSMADRGYKLSPEYIHDATVDEVIDHVEQRELDPQHALNAEQKSDDPRKTLVGALERTIKQRAEAHAQVRKDQAQAKKG